MTKIGALFIAVLYVVGFLVLNSYYARFGIADFTVLRAKSLAAGALFLFLAWWPIFFSAKMFGLLNMGQWEFYAELIRENTALSMSVGSFALYGQFCILTLATKFLFVTPLDIVYFLGSNVAAIFFAIFCPLAARRISKRGLAIVLVFLVVATIILNIVFGKNEKESLAVVIWYCWVALQSVWLVGKRNGTPVWQSLLSKGQIGLFFTIVTGFGLLVYGDISPTYGGGHLKKVAIFLTSDAPKQVLPSPLTAFLIEESDHGYYLLRSTENHNAIYLPREVTRGMEFLTDDKRPSLSK